MVVPYRTGCVTVFIKLCYAECSAPPKRTDLTVITSTRLIEYLYVEGDSISYLCTGNGETDDDVISVCEDDGQWSLQTLPTCCKYGKKSNQLPCNELDILICHQNSDMQCNHNKSVINVCEDAVCEHDSD